MSFLLLSEIKPCVTESYICAIVFKGILKILFTFYLPKLTSCAETLYSVYNCDIL